METVVGKRTGTMKETGTGLVAGPRNRTGTVVEGGVQYKSTETETSAKGTYIYDISV